MKVLTPQSLDMAATASVDSGSGRAHAKAILLGEHAVLYGSPALAIPVPRLTVTARATRFAEPGTTVFLMNGPTGTTPYTCDGLEKIAEALTGGGDGRRVEVLLQCEIPAGRGLGSSAACARAAVLALADLFNRDLDPSEVYELVQVAENIAHGRASGVDALTTGAVAPVLFENGTADQVRIGFDGLFVIADSGVAGRTKDAVRLVRDAFEQQPGVRERFVGTVSELVRQAVRALVDGDANGFGASMSDCHVALCELGLSTVLVDGMIDAAVSAGALGAKISGGGLGGCVIALADSQEDAWGVGRALCEAGAVHTWTVPVERYARHDR
ncbi:MULTISPECIES: mevalonate kinase [Streptomyces]|uniref:mevalonate kinase n=1 Tax=Streptomyces TaxID=1883 RepID=UPI001F08E4F4|nr:MULTISPECIES: mevalonate kinase [Streptomyces]MDX3064372.1 mevalonate kinase [Streptomyces sp. ND04-05B]MDX3519658.1 mevalonate kinase [Streptomyces scabiei]